MATITYHGKDLQWDTITVETIGNDVRSDA